MEHQLTLEEAKAYIDSINFSNIINKMVKHQGWLMKDAKQLSKMYGNFLYLTKKYGDKYKLPPSEEIDEFWHNHILDTESYRRDCQMIFGKYLDHYPYFGIDGKTNFQDLEKAFDDMLVLYQKEFDEPLLQVRTMYSKLIYFFKKKIQKSPNRSKVS